MYKCNSAFYDSNYTELFLFCQIKNNGGRKKPADDDRDFVKADEGFCRHNFIILLLFCFVKSVQDFGFDELKSIAF